MSSSLVAVPMTYNGFQTESKYQDNMNNSSNIIIRNLNDESLRNIKQRNLKKTEAIVILEKIFYDNTEKLVKIQANITNGVNVNFNRQQFYDI